MLPLPPQNRMPTPQNQTDPPTLPSSESLSPQNESYRASPPTIPSSSDFQPEVTPNNVEARPKRGNHRILDPL